MRDLRSFSPAVSQPTSEWKSDFMTGCSTLWLSSAAIKVQTHWLVLCVVVYSTFQLFFVFIDSLPHRLCACDQVHMTLVCVCVCVCVCVNLWAVLLSRLYCLTAFIDVYWKKKSLWFDPSSALSFTLPFSLCFLLFRISIPRDFCRAEGHGGYSTAAAVLNSTASQFLQIRRSSCVAHYGVFMLEVGWI